MRIDVALRNLTDGARAAAHAKPISIEESLVREIMAASNNSPSSYAVKKKAEIERIAVSSR